MERYFKPVNKTANADDLPVDPAGSLSLSFLPAAIKQVNQEVQVAQELKLTIISKKTKKFNLTKYPALRYIMKCD